VHSAGGLFFWAVLCCMLGPVGAGRPLKTPRELRTRTALEEGLVTKRTANLRAELYDKFAAYLESALPAFSVDSLAREYPSILSEWVAEFVTHCYLEGWGRTRTAEALLAIMDRHGALRQSLGAAWRLMRSWQLSEPADLHPPCPMKLLKAMVVTALA